MLNLIIASAMAMLLSFGSAYAQELGFSRRLLNTSTYLNSFENRVLPSQPVGRKGSVLVIFRTSEQGAVIDARVLSGPSDLRISALEAVNHWKFKPVSLNGQPIQMDSAAVIDWSQIVPEIQAAKPMTGEQLSPDLQLNCLNELLHEDPSSVESCRQQLKTVMQTSSSPMDRFTANDEFGLALLKYSQDAKQAADYFSQARDSAGETEAVRR